MRVLPLLLIAVLSACPRATTPDAPDGGDGGVASACADTCAAHERCDQASGTCVLSVADRCTSGTSWAPGAQAFVDSSAQWGLTGKVAEGVRLSTADLDGDGRADLAVRRAGNHQDDASDGGTRAVWLLRNAGGHFEDVTHTSGLLTLRGAAAGKGRPAEIIVFADVDNDGDVDAFTGASATTSETSEVLLNDGAGNFTIGPEANDVRVVGDAIGGAAFLDANHDGTIDLFLGGASKGGTGTQDRLYLGIGGGAFAEITGAAGLTTQAWAAIGTLNEAKAHTVSWGVAACDLNGDGRAELLSASYGRAPNHLWTAQPSTGIPAYANASISSGYAFDPRADWTDNESARCYCKLNPTAPDCAGVPPPQYIVCQSASDVFRWNHDTDREPFRLGGNTGTTVCADVDADGDLDLLNTEIVHWDVGSSSDPTELLLNDGAVTFTRPGNDATGLVRTHAGVSWDDGDITGAIFDFDNDGLLDVYVGSTDYPGTRGLLYHQLPGGGAVPTFEPVPLAEGIDHQSSHGVAVADFDRDGDLDLVAGHSRVRCSSGSHCYPEGHARLFENVLGQSGNWLQLELRGSGATNRSAIGAQVTVKANGRTQRLEVGGGHGHYGIQHDLVQHAGLGSACEAEVTVRWPDAAGTTQTFVLPSNYRYRIEQGGRPEPL